jgi:hypothetical protein
MSRYHPQDIREKIKTISVEHFLTLHDVKEMKKRSTRIRYTSSDEYNNFKYLIVLVMENKRYDIIEAVLKYFPSDIPCLGKKSIIDRCVKESNIQFLDLYVKTHGTRTLRKYIQELIVRYGNMDVFDFFLNKARGVFRKSIFTLVCERGNVDMFDKLIAAGYGLNDKISKRYPHNPGYAAIRARNYDDSSLIDRLIMHGFDFRSQVPWMDKSYISHALSYNDRMYVTRLVDSGIAIEEGDIPHVKDFISHNNTRESFDFISSVLVSSTMEVKVEFIQTFYIPRCDLEYLAQKIGISGDILKDLPVPVSGEEGSNEDLDDEDIKEADDDGDKD